MICDLCNSNIPDKPTCLVGTKELVTSKHCWGIYLKSLIADKVLTCEDIPQSLPSLVGQMACSDTPWALCERCTAHLTKAGFHFSSDGVELPPHGHAICRSSKPMEFEVLDEHAIGEAFKAAKAAVAEIL